MSFFGNWRRAFVTALMLTVVMTLPVAAQAQGLSIPGLSNGNQGEEQAKQDPRALRDSLDQVIATLENDAQRGELLARLKELRQATESVSPDKGEERTGLLGALADSITDYGEQAEAGRAPLDIWAQRSRRAGQEVESLLASTSRTELVRALVETAVLLGVWLGLLTLLMGVGRYLARRNDWPRVLPPEPRAGLLASHFLRKALPWGLAFAVMLVSLRWLNAPAPSRAAVLVLAYITLCGRLLATVFEVVISVFTRGHRRVAVAILRQQALKRLFVIGALAALGDAANSERLVTLLGNDLSGWLSASANVLAGLISGRLVLRIKRPVEHLIRNRPYSLRRDKSTLRDLTNILARLWHVPALLLIGASLVAIFVTGGEADGAFTRAIINAALLVLALVFTGVLRRYGEKAVHRRRLSQYRRRIERFGHALGHLVIWVVFAELSLRVWGFSLLGIGADGAISARIGRALLGIGLTIMLAWLIWIVADTGIQRALNTSARIRGRRAYNTRAQTITPMIRNVVFVTIVVIAAIVGLANLGVNVTPLLAGAGVIGLAIGFGAQTLVQDLITGLFILIEDSLSIDDFVNVGGHMGTVERLSLRTVRLRDLDGIVHIIPFSQIKGIQNFSREFGIALIRIRVPHDMMIDDAIALARDVAEELRHDPMMRHHIWSPLELQGIESFDQGAAILRVRLRTGPVMQWDVARAFNLRLKQRLEMDGQDLAMPRMSVVMQNASRPQDEEQHSGGSFASSQGVGHGGPSEGEATPQGG
ncbi:Small-conductance mechanosensitive channel [Modicisalibacter ilicicola DSM 19980]|uniref:Small-conductance mechanosensitive channel n=1 Tax=Modicisalibacter ilicicola DSM 19980 TaxID=1121942 RepID=A0A1M4T400_9GAMM|nr:mechanosensitive ion channel family protein [Halomonas ilicicola]SHE39027.1 Small-conductance mechanosensitive channel [Halomonas ilicicola DSM 19980]